MYMFIGLTQSKKTSCIKDILKNRTYNFSVETSFCQFSNMASSGLNCKINIVFRPEEAMFENWQKLVSTEKLYVLFLQISLIHEIKQNEKYPYAEKTSVMITPKHLGAHIWQIYPSQLSIDALNTITPNLADLPSLVQCILGYILWDVFDSHFDSSRKGGNFLLFLHNEGSNQSVSIVESCQM